MGNTLITSLCRREERVDFEDISDATFDFISVAVHKDALDASTLKTHTKTSAVTRKQSVSSQTIAPSKRVAVVPVTLAPSLSSRTIVGSPAPSLASPGDDAMSFNDRLNMLTWDPETTPLPTPFKHDDLYVFDEYSATPTNRSHSTKATQSPDGWIRRAVDKYEETKTRRRDAKLKRRQRLLAEQADATTTTTPRQTSSKKRSLQMTLWGKRTSTTKTKTTKDLPYQLPLMSSMSSVLDEDDEEQRFLFDQDANSSTTAQDIDHQALLKNKRLDDEEEPISDTESDDSGSDATTLCRFYARFDNDAASTSSNDMDDDSECDFSDWTRSTSTSSCYYSAAEDDNQTTREEEQDAAFFSSQDALCVTLSDYLCECGDCPSYMTIEREVTNSNCWMNETERRALCHVLQAYSTYRPKTAFHKDMIAAAEECLLVFQGDEHAAFNAFVMLAQAKW